jgi:isoamylase
MTDEAWNAGFRSLGVRLDGDLIDDVTERGDPIVGATVLLLLNAYHEPVQFTLPDTKANQVWDRLFDTAVEAGLAPVSEHRGGEAYPLEGRSFAMFRTRNLEQESTATAKTDVP